MTWTSAFGKGSGWLLQKIVNGLALTRISPNMLTFIGLVINIIAACFFGFARANNANRMFLYAGLIIIGAGVFDMVDGRVARKTNQVSVFGAFFDSVMDRYSDVAIFFGLLIYYARGQSAVLCGAGGVCDDGVRDGELHAGSGRGVDRDVQGRVHGAAGADCLRDSGGACATAGG